MAHLGYSCWTSRHPLNGQNERTLLKPAVVDDTIRVQMPSPIDPPKQLAIRLLIEELDSIVDLNTDESNARCRHIALELAELLKTGDPVEDVEGEALAQSQVRLSRARRRNRDKTIH